jgi:hypothetical protein
VVELPSIEWLRQARELGLSRVSTADYHLSFDYPSLQTLAEGAIKAATKKLDETLAKGPAPDAVPYPPGWRPTLMLVDDAPPPPEVAEEAKLAQEKRAYEDALFPPGGE